MATTLDIKKIRKLSVDDRLELIDTIWKTLKSEFKDSKEVLDEMERRVEELETHPDLALSHEEFTSRLKKLMRS